MALLFELFFQAIAEFICEAIHRAIGTMGCVILGLIAVGIIGLILWAVL